MNLEGISLYSRYRADLGLASLKNVRHQAHIQKGAATNVTAPFARNGFTLNGFPAVFLLQLVIPFHFLFDDDFPLKSVHIPKLPLHFFVFDVEGSILWKFS